MTVFPNRETLQKILEMAGGGPEGAVYAQQQLQSIKDTTFNNSKTTEEMKQYQIAAMVAVEKYVEFVIFKYLIERQPWSGQTVEVPSTATANLNIALAGLKDLNKAEKEVLQGISLDYAVSKTGNEQGKYVRAYSNKNGTVNQKAVDVLDKVFNSWLAEKGYLIKGGFLYNVDSGQEETDRIKPDIVEQLIAQGDLKKYMEDKGVIGLTMNKRSYPGEEALKKRAQEAVDQEPLTPEERGAGAGGAGGRK